MKSTDAMPSLIQSRRAERRSARGRHQYGIPGTSSESEVVASDELLTGGIVVPVGSPSQERRAGSRGVVGIHR
jgi:hypothetical protein